MCYRLLMSEKLQSCLWWWVCFLVYCINGLVDFYCVWFSLWFLIWLLFCVVVFCVFFPCPGWLIYWNFLLLSLCMMFDVNFIDFRCLSVCSINSSTTKMLQLRYITWQNFSTYKIHCADKAFCWIRANVPFSNNTILCLNFIMIIYYLFFTINLFS